MSNECMSLRMTCATDEFRGQLKEAYIKYLAETLCVKSKRTRDGIYWLFNFLKKVKLYQMKKSYAMLRNSTTNSQQETGLPDLPATILISAQSSSLLFLSTSTSIFQLKLFSYYNLNNMNIPLIPFTYKIQQVYHSTDFSHLLDLFGVVRTDTGFPFVPNDWLNKNKNKLNECLSSLEKCLCI